MTNLAHLLDATADAHPDRVAIIHGRQHLSYAEVRAQANQVANVLVSRGVRRGDKVALSCPNLPHFTVAYFGILKAGGTVVPLNILLKAREVAYHLADSDAAVYISYVGDDSLPVGAESQTGFEATAGCRELLLIGTEPARAMPWIDGLSERFDTVQVDDDDTAVILYTSGTTGQPKGAELRHRNMRDNALLAGPVFGVDRDEPDAFLCVLPLFHSFGQTCIQNAAVAFGGTVVMQPRFEAEAALRLMIDHEVSFFAGVPTMYWALLAAAEDTSATSTISKNLRIAASGGAALPVELHRQFQDTFGITILEGYGLSETSPLASFSRISEEPRIGSIGRPVPGVEMKLIDSSWSEVEDTPDTIGEIAIRGHNIMKGYYRRPDATAEVIRDGWFRSGDLGRKDADGFFYVVDRTKDMIIRGGFNVYPRELEEVLLEHPDVSLVAVIGVPHKSHGEEIKAVVIKVPGSGLTEGQLIAWSREQLAGYKYPRIVEFVDALPMTSTGKILKRELPRTSTL